MPQRGHQVDPTAKRSLVSRPESIPEGSLRETPGVDIAAAGAIVFDDRRRLLLIRRLRPPGAGLWSIPGGKCRPGESPSDACVRELAEETGLRVGVDRFAGRVVRAAGPGDQFVIDDFVCRVLGGDVAAGDDAAEARWCTLADLGRLSLVEGLTAALAAWDLLPD